MSATIQALTSSARFAGLLERERASFAARTPASRQISEDSTGTLFRGVPMPWMLEWPNPYPLYAARAQGSRLWDMDGNEYLDFCLGDTGSMFGHSECPLCLTSYPDPERILCTSYPATTAASRPNPRAVSMQLGPRTYDQRTHNLSIAGS